MNNILVNRLNGKPRNQAKFYRIAKDWRRTHDECYLKEACSFLRVSYDDKRMVSFVRNNLEYYYSM